jgi:hypothetical protein
VAAVSIPSNRPQEIEGVSIAAELDEVLASLSGVHYLTQIIRFDQMLHPGTDEKLIARGVSAALAFVSARLRLLRRACGGSIDPAQLLDDHNAAYGNEDDVVLPLKATPKRTSRGRRQRRGGRAR